MFNSAGRGRNAATTIPAASALASSPKRGISFSVIGPDIVITGNVNATADLHIDGRIEGDVTCGVLAQGPDSSIFGNVTAESARLAGMIEGTVHARQLTIERSARIVGDVEYENITIENGGAIDGRMKHMGMAATVAPPAPAAITTTGPRVVDLLPHDDDDDLSPPGRLIA